MKTLHDFTNTSTYNKLSLNFTRLGLIRLGNLLSWSFSWFCLVPPCRYQNGILKQATAISSDNRNNSLPILRPLLKFLFHYPLYPSALCPLSWHFYFFYMVNRNMNSSQIELLLPQPPATIDIFLISTRWQHSYNHWQWFYITCELIWDICSFL